MHQANDLFIGDSRFDKMNYQICDFTDVSSIDFNIKEVEIISVLDKSATHWNKTVKVAFITNDDYMKKIIQAYTKGMQETNWSFKIFDNIKDA